MRQAVADTEIYGAPAEMVGCPTTTEVLAPTEVAEVADMLGQTYWRQESRLISKYKIIHKIQIHKINF